MEGMSSSADRLVRPDESDSCFQSALEAAKLEAMAEFAAGAGHEINNPLTVISGRAQLLLRDEADPERRRALALIVAQAMRVHEMIADMMLFARPPRPELQRVELGQLIDDILVDVSARCASQDTAIRRTGEAGPIFIQADPVQLAVALRAVCQNAIEALGNGGHIEIGLASISDHTARNASVASSGADIPVGPLGRTLSGRQECPPHRGEKCGLETGANRSVSIQIRDDGPGLRPEEREHLFDPFYSARQAGRGLGLGLSKAWRIVTNHGGRIEVESQPGRGASFTIVLAAGDQAC
jgi:signal transduction histidine kinase